MKLTATQETTRVLQQAREDFRTRVERVPAIIYTDAPDFEEDGVYVNPHVQDVLGISQRDFLETDAWIDMMHPEDRDRVVREYQAYRNGGAAVADYRVVRHDGTIIWIRDRATLVRDTASGLMFEHGILFDVTELKQAEEVITRQVELLKKVDLIGRDFTALVLRGADLGRILEGLARITGNPVVLEDAAHRPIGSAGSENVVESLLDDWAGHSRDGHSSNGPGLTRERGERGCVWTPITLRDETWGRLHLVEDGRSIDEVDALALDRAAAAVSLSLLSERDAAGLAEQAGGLGIHMEGLRLACMALQLRGFSGGVQEQDLRRVGAGILGDVRSAIEATGCTGIAALDGARVLAIVGVSDEVSERYVLASIGEEARRLIESRVGLGTAVGATMVDGGSVRRGLEEALEAAAFGDGVGSDIHFFEDLGVRHLLARLAQGPELARFVESELKPLLDHDSRSTSPLVPTLRTYLNSGGSKAASARLLHVDRRTLYHRLERIERLLGRSLDAPEAALELGVAIKGLDVLERRSGANRA